MPVTDVSHDLDTLTLTIVAEFSAPVQRIWDLYADPRQLEKVWGPPGFPATFVDHSLVPGGRTNYYMTSPDGEKYYGWWEIESVDEQKTFTFLDGFAMDEKFTKNPDMPVSHNVYSFAEVDGTTRATYTGTYESAEGLQKVLEMGAVEGTTLAINQIDALISA